MRLTKEDGWQVLTSPEYLRQSAAFMQTIEDLVDGARRNDLDGAAVAYAAMTMRCYQCHRYLKGQRRADRTPATGRLRIAADPSVRKLRQSNYWTVRELMGGGMSRRPSGRRFVCATNVGTRRAASF